MKPCPEGQGFAARACASGKVDTHYCIAPLDHSKDEGSAQIAKRYYDLGLRGGIFESTGGIGADYYFFDDRLVFLTGGL